MATKKAKAKTHVKAPAATASTTSNTVVTAVANDKVKFIKNKPLVGATIAEFVGTFLLVSSVFAVQGTALYLAFMLFGLVLIFGGVSGAHFNPSFSFAAWVTKRIDRTRAIAYIIAQLLGGLAAFLLLNAFVAATKGDAATTSSMYGASTLSQLYHTAATPDGKAWIVFAGELIGTLIFSLGVSFALKRKPEERTTAGAAVGFSLLTGAMIASVITANLSASTGEGFNFLNPAVALGTTIAAGINVFSGNILLIYLVAPLIGATAGFLIEDTIAKTKK